MLVPKFLSKKEKIISDKFFETLQKYVSEDLKEIYDKVFNMYKSN
jgi:hypothetical protein